jgi:hypothetical protein
VVFLLLFYFRLLGRLAWVYQELTSITIWGEAEEDEEAQPPP